MVEPRNSFYGECKQCWIYKQEIIQLQGRIFSLESEIGQHQTLPLNHSGKQISTFPQRVRTINLNDTVSFPRLQTAWNKTGARPKQKDNKYEAISANIGPATLELKNRFSLLAQCSADYDSQGDNETQNNAQNDPRPKDTARSVLLIGDGVISRVKDKTFAVESYSGYGVNDIRRIIPRVMAAHPGVSHVVLHCGALDIRNQQTEKLKRDFTELFDELQKVDATFAVSGPIVNIDGKSEKFSRLHQLNSFLRKHCALRNLQYIENFDLFWKREDLFEGRGARLSRDGVRVLTDNLLHALRHRPEQGQQVREKKKRKKKTQLRSPAVPPRFRAKQQQTTQQTQQAPSASAPPSVPSPAPGPSPVSAASAPQAASAASAASAPPPAGPASQTPARPVTAPVEASAAPASSPPKDQPWAPGATSTPSRDTSFSLSPPPSPMALPSHCEGLIRSGIKSVPLTPNNIARSRVLLAAMNSSPAPQACSSPSPPCPQPKSPPPPSQQPPPLPPRSSPPHPPPRPSPNHPPPPLPPRPSPKLSPAGPLPSPCRTVSTR